MAADHQGSAVLQRRPASARSGCELAAEPLGQRRVEPWNVETKIGSSSFAPRTCRGASATQRGSSPAGLCSTSRNAHWRGVKICGHLMGEYPPAHASVLEALDFGLSPSGGGTTERSRPARRQIHTMHDSKSMGAVMKEWAGVKHEPHAGPSSRKGYGGTTKWLLPTDPLSHSVEREDRDDVRPTKGYGEYALLYEGITDPITHRHLQGLDGHGHWVRKARGLCAPSRGSPITPDWSLELQFPEYCQAGIGDTGTSSQSSPRSSLQACGRSRSSPALAGSRGGAAAQQGAGGGALGPPSCSSAAPSVADCGGAARAPSGAASMASSASDPVARPGKAATGRTSTSRRPASSSASSTCSSGSLRRQGPRGPFAPPGRASGTASRRRAAQ
mmetsp:Transcript_113327/g.353296  ORF Transcript_113327/g.353296 Transcript_113327/m.353296 type:complete len:388 (-) Transcript_113327:463-1626(-)